MKRNRWDDHYARRAKEEKWLARSVFKLQEINEKFKLIQKGHRILDLGCYPGSWSQYGLKKVGPGGKIVGIDQVRPERISHRNFKFIQSDVLTLDLEWLKGEVGSVDMVISDLAPRTSGDASVDSIRSLSLACRALEIALTLLKKSGHFVCKVFEGEDLKQFRSEMSGHFLNARAYRPSAVRKGSREIYLIGRELERLDPPDSKKKS